MPNLIPVDYDPFAQEKRQEGPRLVPVDYNPFEESSPKNGGGGGLPDSLADIPMASSHAPTSSGAQPFSTPWESYPTGGLPASSPTAEPAAQQQATPSGLGGLQQGEAMDMLTGQKGQASTGLEMVGKPDAQAPSRWQDAYAAPGWQDRLTMLQPDEEAAFQQWAQKNKVPLTADYDMRGFWKYGGQTGLNQNDGKIHYTDRYKTPLHQSFSGESMYARQDIPGPTWNEKDQLVAPDGAVLFDERARAKKRAQAAGDSPAPIVARGYKRQDAEQAANTFAQKVKEYAAYAPYLGVSALAGLVKPFLAPLEGTQFDTNKLLAEAVQFWKGQTGKAEAAIPDIGLFPYKEGGGVFETEDPNAPAQGFKIPGLNAVARPFQENVKDVAGEVASGLGFMAGPVRVAGKAAALAVDKLLPEATPAVLKAVGRGLTTGALLGEGKPDLTAENALTFALFDVLGHGLGAATDATKSVAKKIADSSWWREMTIKERGLVVQSLEEQVDAMWRQGMTDGQILRTIKRQYGADSPEFKEQWEKTAERTGRVPRSAQAFEAEAAESETGGSAPGGKPEPPVSSPAPEAEAKESGPTAAPEPPKAAPAPGTKPGTHLGQNAGGPGTGPGTTPGGPGTKQGQPAATAEAAPQDARIGQYVRSGSYTGRIDGIARDGSIISGQMRIPVGAAPNFAIQPEAFEEQEGAPQNAEAVTPATEGKKKAPQRGKKSNAALDENQVDFIRNRVEQLGGMDAVAKVYTGKDEASRFALAYAKSLYGQPEAAKSDGAPIPMGGGEEHAGGIRSDAGQVHGGSGGQVEGEQPRPGAGKEVPGAPVQERPGKGRKDLEQQEPGSTSGQGTAVEASVSPVSPVSPVVVVKSDGTPYATEKAARMAAVGRRKRTGKAWEPVQVEGGWGVRESGISTAPASIPPRPLVNPHASALKKDAQLRAQQRWDKKYGSRAPAEPAQEGQIVPQEARNDVTRVPGQDGQETAPKSPEKSKNKIVGTNPNGHVVEEDENGVRSYTESGIRVRQRVRVAPTRSGVETYHDSPQKMFEAGDSDFLTKEEVAAFTKEKEAQKQDASLPAQQEGRIVEVKKAPPKEDPDAERLRPAANPPVPPVGQEGPAVDRGAGHEGPRPEDALGAEAGRKPGEGGEPDRGPDSGELRGGGQPSDVRRRQGEGPREETPSPDHGAQSGMEPGPSGRAGVPGRRAGGARRGVDYHAPAGALARTGSWRDAAARNLDIIELVKKLDAEKRQATPQEQTLLAQYVGWGPGEIRNNLFPVTQFGKDAGEINPYAVDRAWRPLFERAQGLLSAEERKAVLRSTQYAHYTSEEMVRAIWDGLRRLGFEHGKILEPGMGTGLFATAAPEDVLAKSRYTGIEMDPVTAAIAHQLLPRQNVISGDFVRQKLPRDFFDVAIGNPPFAKTVILDDPEYKKNRFSLHDYFFAKAMDRVRPGGLLTFITSRFTMDKLDDRARRFLADRADLLGAIRLPQTAFKANAGTEVVTDVIFLRKRLPGEAPGGQAWDALNEIQTPEGTAQINEYFATHPDMILGRSSLTGSMYRDKGYTVLPNDGDINQQFAEAVAKLPQGVYTPGPVGGPEQLRHETVERDFNPATRKEGALYLDEQGQPRVVESGTGVDVRTRLKKFTPQQVKWLKDYVGLKDAMKQAQYDQLNDGDWEKSLAALNKAYDAFVKKHGKLEEHTRSERVTVGKDGEEATIVTIRYKNKQLLALDVESPLTAQLEDIQEDGSIQKGAFLLGRTLGKRATPEIKGTKDALFVSLDQQGVLDLAHVAKLAKKSKADVIKELGDLIYEAPGSGWQLADEYLSGDVVAKLEEAKTAADADSRYERNVAALAKVQPEPLPYDKITLSIGQNWIPVSHIQQFTSEVMGIDTRVSYNKDAAVWDVPGARIRSGRGSASDYATPDRSPEEILAAALNNIQIVVKRTEKTESGTKTFTDPEATALAQEKVRKVRDDFSRWAWQDAARAGELVDLYNRKFNNIAPRRFDGSHLTLPGLSLKYELYGHQAGAIWRVVQTGNTYLAHAVGAGKTLEMIVSAMEQRRLGLINRPMFVVPNHMLRQFAGEFMEAYPAANVMVADEENFHTSNRRQFLAQATMNDPDAIIITHSAFGRIGIKKETMQEVSRGIISQLRAAIADADNRYSRSKLEQRLEQLERRIESRSMQKDDAISFEEMGVDFLYVDEAHEFRKLDFVTNRDKMKGIDPTGSAKAFDLFAKVRYLEHQYAHGRTHVFASGTPVTNTMAELYSIMRFMDPEALEKDGIETFDAWANMFGQPATNMEQNAAGQYEPVERFSKFVNVPELMKRVRSFMDVLTTPQLKHLVQVPTLKTGFPQNVVAQASPELKAYMEEVLGPRIKASRRWKPSRSQPGNPDPLINIITDGRLAAIDMRYVSDARDDPDSKLNRMVDGIIEEYKATSANRYEKDPKPGGAQIVFSAVGFGGMVRVSRDFDVRKFIMNRFAKAGIPASQVAWMEDYKTHAKKQAMFKEMQEGTKRILIGSPKNMGTGVNVQRRLTALHYLSPPWYPSDVEQPQGRILRQGNLNPEVSISWYATKGTYDSTQWGMVARKGKFVEQAMTGDVNVRTIEDISEVAQYEMAAALAAGDDRAIKLAGLKGDVEKLHRLKTAHAEEQRHFRGEIRDLGNKEKGIKESIAKLEEAKASIGDAPIYGGGFFAVVDGKTYRRSTDIGEALLEKARREIAGWEPRTRKDENSFLIGEALGKHKVLFHVRAGGKEGALTKIASSFSIKIGPETRTLAMEGKEGQGILEDDPQGLSSKIQSRLARVAQDLEAAKQALVETRTEREGFEKRAGAPFPQEGELGEKVAEVARLEAEMLADSAGEADQGKGAASISASGKKVGLTVAAARSVSDALDRVAKAAGQTIVAQSVNDMPPTAQREYKAILAQAGGKGRIRALYHGGVTYLIADNLTSPADAMAAWMHEQVGHGGVRRLFPSDRQFRNVLDLVYRSLPLAERRRIGTLYGIRGTDLDSRLKLAKEHLAQLAEKVSLDETLGPKERPAWRRFLAAIRELWGKLWRKITGKPLSEKEMAGIVKDAARLVVHGEAGGEARATYKRATGEPVMGEAADLGRGEGRASIAPDDTKKQPRPKTVREHIAAALQRVRGLPDVANTPLLKDVGPDMEQSRTFVNKLWEARDIAAYDIQRATRSMERQVQILAGSVRSPRIPHPLTNETAKDSKKARDLAMAMMIYRDLQISPYKAQEFKDWAAEALPMARGAERIRIKEQLRILDQAESLTSAQKEFVDKTMDDAFAETTRLSKAYGIISTALDHYVRRIWNLPKGKEDQYTGSALYGFKQFTTARMQRTLETVLDGWMQGLDLKVKGIVNSWDAIASEVATIVANKTFIKEGMRLGIFTSDSKVQGFKELRASGFQVWTRKAGVKLTLKDESALMDVDSYGRKMFFAPPSASWAVYKDQETVDKVLQAGTSRGSRAEKVFDDEATARAWAKENEMPAPVFRQAADAFEKVPLYAPARIADMLNTMTRTASDLWQKPIPKALMRFNSGVKSWILMTSFFHHLAGARSWMLGVNQGVGKSLARGDVAEAANGFWKAVNVVGAHKEGLKKIEANDALLRVGIKNGLTLGRMQDWEETEMEESRGATERLVQWLGLEAADKAIQAGKLFREKAASSLFKRYFAGLKSEAFCLEYGRRLAEAQASGKPHDPDLIAEQVARLINADFGGLHLKRMGRHPDLQKLIRLLALAPDWTESNFRTVTGMFPGLNEAIDRGIGNAPPPPGMGKTYRNWWAGVLLKGVLSTILVQVAINGWEDTKKFWSEEFSSVDQARRLRWTHVDVTKAYKALGIPLPTDERRLFSLVGHFADPLKLTDPERLAKGKASPIIRTLLAAGTKSDWLGRPYTDMKDLLTTGQVVKRSRHEQTENFFAALPSMVIEQARGMQPIQVQEVLRFMQGEQDGLSALMRSMGASVVPEVRPDPLKEHYDEVAHRVRMTDKAVKDAYTSEEKMALRKDNPDFQRLLDLRDVLEQADQKLSLARNGVSIMKRKIPVGDERYLQMHEAENAIRQGFLDVAKGKGIE